MLKTFSFQKYGALKGTLIWVSPDAEDKSSTGQGDGQQGQSGKTSPDPKANKPAYKYKVHVRPEKTSFIVDGKAAPIQAGMTAQADIVTDHRRINGSYGSLIYDGLTGESKESYYDASIGESTMFDYTPNANGSDEKKIWSTYSDGS